MIDVTFAGGESRQNHKLGCNYMIAKIIDDYGRDAELYAEALVPDSWYDMDEIPDADRESFDKSSFEELKEEITQQAKDAGIDPAELKFWEG